MTESRPLTVVFCLPGSSYSGRFLQCWSELLLWCVQRGIRPVISQHSSCNIYYVRTMCLGGETLRGPEQKPFDGRLAYDYLMWIDSDILCSPDDFAALLKHNADIVSGVYLMADGRHLAAVKEWDEEHYLAHGAFQFLDPHDLDNHEGLLPVAYTGMGFMLVRHGVFEALEYPWFRPLEKRIGPAVDFTMEDVAFCLRAREKGYAVLVDPRVRVRHEKLVAL